VETDFWERWIAHQMNLLRGDAMTGNNPNLQTAAWLWYFGLRLGRELIEAMKAEAESGKQQ